MSSDKKYSSGRAEKLQKEIDRSWRRRRAGWQESKKREEGNEPP